jgi:hypothetical protein
MQVIMTLHENLQLCPKLDEIYLSKDKNLFKYNFDSNFKI